mmetsp:Transcript_90104/g.254093  ORF Transcript_90104/g.254093 Transcript_90104/m.254093 type:complete len:231 (-) Transcript_90104:402-1094(-)
MVPLPGLAPGRGLHPAGRRQALRGCKGTLGAWPRTCELHRGGHESGHRRQRAVRWTAHQMVGPSCAIRRCAPLRRFAAPARAEQQPARRAASYWRPGAKPPHAPQEPVALRLGPIHATPSADARLGIGHRPLGGVARGAGGRRSPARGGRLRDAHPAGDFGAGGVLLRFPVPQLAPQRRLLLFLHGRGRLLPTGPEFLALFLRNGHDISRHCRAHCWLHDGEEPFRRLAL